MAPLLRLAAFVAAIAPCLAVVASNKTLLTVTHATDIFVAPTLSVQNTGTAPTSSHREPSISIITVTKSLHTATILASPKQSTSLTTVTINLHSSSSLASLEPITTTTTVTKDLEFPSSHTLRKHITTTTTVFRHKSLDLVSSHVSTEQGARTTTITRNLHFVTSLASPEPSMPSPPAPSASQVQGSFAIKNQTPSNMLVEAMKQHGTPNTTGLSSGRPGFVQLHILNTKEETIPLLRSTSSRYYRPWSDSENVDDDHLFPGKWTRFWLPLGYHGMFALGIADGSKIEIANRDARQPHVDVSYVDGFSHEIVCACGRNQKPITGCNIPLFDYGTCPSPMAGGACRNPARSHDHGPAHKFFAACQGSAYTFPHDDAADRGCPYATELECCVGPKCKAAHLQRVHHT